MKIKSMKEFRDAGLLWYINRVAFHPRGYALALDIDEDGDVIGWGIMGDGSEVWEFGGDEDKHFEAVEKVFSDARNHIDEEGIEVDD